MSKFKTSLFFCVIVLLLVGCRGKSAKLQSSAVPPDKTLYANGTEWLKKSNFLKSRLAFQTLINTYPDSELAPKAFFAIADSYYKEASKEALLQAEAQYKDFMVFYPTHEKTAEAQLKIAALNMRMMEAPDRDKTYALKAEAELKSFIEQFPNHRLIPEARHQLKEVQEVLAKGDYLVGQFYYQKKSYPAAISRFEDVAKKYPNFTLIDQTYFLLADALQKKGRVDEAATYYGKIASGFPSSSKFNAAKDRLAELQKPVPTVDMAFAAEHERNKKKDERFAFIRNPWKEVKSVFSSGPDPFEEAVKSAEVRLSAQRSQQAQAEKEKPEGTLQRSDRDRIEIETEIRKSPTGEATDKTTIKQPATNLKVEPETRGEPSDRGKNGTKKKGLVKKIFRVGP